MTWVRIDDHFDEHPKIAKLSDSAVAMFVAGLAYCNRNLTDGFIPCAIGHGKLRFCDGNPKPILRELEAAGLFEPCEGGGWRIHDYGDYQPSKKDVLKQRRKISERVSTFRKKRRNAIGNSVTTGNVTPLLGGLQPEGNALCNALCNASVTPAPVPVPVPVPDKRTTKNRTDAAAGASGDASPRGNGKETKTALKEVLDTPELKARADRICGGIESLPRKSTAFHPWQCLQLLVNGKLPVGVGLKILLTVRDRWEKIDHPWKYVQAVLDKEHMALHIRLMEAEHQARKNQKSNLEVLGAVFRRIGEHAQEPAASPEPGEGDEAFS